MAETAPKELRLRSYQVGFGDCFLLTFTYSKSVRRHVLVDFGSTGLPRTAPEGVLGLIATDVAKECGKEPLVVVATHRHKDHVSGFATQKNGKGSGDVVRGCHVKLVLQPWTEDPKAAPDATVPTESLTGSQHLLLALADMHGVASAALDEVRLGALGKTDADQIAFLGDDNLSNLSAVKNLASMAPNRYLYYGAPIRGLARILPGVDVRVLGPPTLEQSKAITKERSRDEAEFWHLQGLAGGLAARPAGSGALFPNATPWKSAPPQTRWFQRRLRAVRGAQLLGLVRALDKAMNNTSLILLLKVGKHRLLFPGDAQIENWLYALTEAKDKAAVAKELAQVNLYKVGHHGSLNATPKSLWGLLEKRGRKGSKERLSTVVSTMSGKHGSKARGTEVPRGKLVDALEAESDFFTTQNLTKKTWYQDHVLALS